MAGSLAREPVELIGDDGYLFRRLRVVHRKQASVYDVATLVPSYAGELVAAEVKARTAQLCGRSALCRSPRRVEGVRTSWRSSRIWLEDRQRHHRWRNVFHLRRKVFRSVPRCCRMR